MQTTRTDRNRIFYHYAFWDMIHDYNEGQKVVAKPKYIMTSEARELGRKLQNAMDSDVRKRNAAAREAGKPETATCASMQFYAKVVNDLLGKRIGHDPIENTEHPNNDRYFSRLMADYRDITHADAQGVIPESGFLPISPYDPVFANKASVMDNGSNLGAVSGAYTGSSSDLTDITKSQSIPFMANLYQQKNGDDYVWQAYERENVVLTSKSDLSGLSQLRRYMSDRTYGEVESYVNAGFGDATKVTLEQMKQRQAGIDRAVAILDELSDMGYEYEIRRDEKVGQLKARIAGTRVDVRILDTPENSEYIGRVYDNGVTMTYYNTYYTRGGSTPNYVTPKDAANLVKFALGEPVESLDGKRVGEAGLSTRRTSKGPSTSNDMYRGSKGMMARYGLFRDQNGKEDTRYNNLTFISVNTEHRSNATTVMKTDQDAAEYLQGAVASARRNYMDSLDIERLISECEAHKGDEDWSPELSANVEIGAIQQSYVDVLLGRRNDLMRPGAALEDFEARMAEGGEFETDTPEAKAMFEAELRELVYPTDMTPAEMVRQHAKDAVEYNIGDYTVDSEGKRFNPVGVSTYQDSIYSQYRNNDDIVKALQILHIPAEELKGNEFYNAAVKDKLVEFDAAHARPMKDLTSPFMKDMYNEVHSTLTRNGLTFTDEDIRIDDNGIVQYQGTLPFTMKVDKSREHLITGRIGQIFEPGLDGVVETKYAGSENYAFVPGYDAIIKPQVPGESKSMEERTKLIGYAEQLKRGIRYTVRQDVMSATEDNPEVGSTTNLNNVYRHVTGERFDLNFREKFMEQKMDESMLAAIIKTEGQRVRYSNAMKDGATIYADYAAQQYGNDPFNDNSGDPYVLAGNQNMAVIMESSDGFFDPIATNATNTTQGLVRFLTDETAVGVDGMMTPGSKDARCALMNHPYTANMSYDPFDRQCMTISNLLQAAAVTRPVHVAQRTCAGWTYDDAIVVSKDFADEYQMRAHDGHMRPLVKGDKLSDFHGNKGVISLIVDPNMTREEAKEQGIEEPWQLFHDNPDMQVMMAPFPATSRFNGGTSRDLMENPSDFHELDGSVVEGGLGQMRMIVTDKAADAKTHAYDRDDVAQGKGRRISAQMAWAMASKGADALMKEFYGGNDGALSNFREALITCGLDISDTGELTVGYTPHEGEVRKVMEMPELQYRTLADGSRGALNQQAMLENFKNQIERSGGLMELPFELTYPIGEPLAPMNDGKTDVIYTEQEWTRKGYTRKDGTVVKATTVHRRVESSQRQTGDVTWGLPVLSSYMRSGQEFDDGTSSIHDYTHAYVDIFRAANSYRDAKARLAEGGLSDKDRAKFERIVENAPKQAQSRFDSIANDIATRQFEGKHNIIKEGLMSHRLANSATAIWTPDPRLNLNEVAMGEMMAKVIDVKDGDNVLIWRDPILRDAGTRYMKVKIDPSLTGIAVNPVMDKPFDGDFDGDTIGVYKLCTKAANREAERLFSVESNLLDLGAPEEDGKYGLAMNLGLDMKVVTHQHPEMADRLAQIRESVNSTELLYDAGGIDYKEAHEERTAALDALNDVFKDSFSYGKAKAGVSYKSAADHVKSVYAACIETGAKGNDKKFANFMHWFGVTCNKAVEGGFDFSSLKDEGHTLSTRSEQEETAYATAVKSHGTGLGGGCSQRGMAALRNLQAKAVLEVTYPVTQSLLQVKHDAEDARHKYKMLLGPVRDLWRGSKIENDEKRGWIVVRDDEGKPVPATKGEWAKQFAEFYESPSGLNTPVDKKWVDKVADALSDGNGMMINVEEAETKSPMDQAAYGGNLKTLAELAGKHVNMFDGKNNELFMPRSVRINHDIDVKKEAGVESDEKRVRIGKSDVLEGRERKAHTAKVAVNIPTNRRTPDVSEGNQHEIDDPHYDGNY